MLPFPPWPIYPAHTFCKPKWHWRLLRPVTLATMTWAAPSSAISTPMVAKTVASQVFLASQDRSSSPPTMMSGIRSIKHQCRMMAAMCYLASLAPTVTSAWNLAICRIGCKAAPPVAIRERPCSSTALLLVAPTWPSITLHTSVKPTLSFRLPVSSTVIRWQVAALLAR